MAGRQPGYTDQVVYAAGGDPYGTSFVNGLAAGDGPDTPALEAARYQGQRLARITIRLLEDTLPDGKGLV